MLSATSITKDYDAPVLRGIDLEIEEGEFVAIMGPSGSGKTTLLHALSGMARPTSGTVKVDGVDLADLNEKELAALRLTKLGFVFQQPHFLASLNLQDNVVLPGFLAKELPRPEVVTRAESLMTDLGVGDLKSRNVVEASGGQLQRVGIARALINQPKIIFGDEPTGALNSRTAGQILDVLSDVNARGTTTVLVTHDPVVAARARRVILLVDGQMVTDTHLGAWSTEATDERKRQVADLLASHGV